MVFRHKRENRGEAKMNKEKCLGITLIAVLAVSAFMLLRPNIVIATGTMDTFEPDNDHTQAHVIANRETQQHSIYPLGDNDWLELRIDCSTNVAIDTHGPSGDTEMWLRYQNLSQIAYNDNGHGTQDYFSKISTHLDPGIYYVQISAYRNLTVIPEYYVNVTYSWMFQSTYGGSGNDVGYSVQQTSDGGYIIAGYTGSFGAGGDDVYLVKTDSSGVMQWNRTYGGSGYDVGLSVQQTSDGGYIIAGYTGSFGAGGDDVYLVKTDSSGVMQWSRTYGGSDDDMGCSVQQTSDGGYIIAGWTKSFGSGNEGVYLIGTDDIGNSAQCRDVILYEGTTMIPAVVYTVLHDPPGDSSYSYFKQTRTTSIETTLSGGASCTVGFEGKVSFLGNGVDASAQVTTHFTGTSSNTLVTSYEVGYTSSQDLQDPWYIGPGYGDAFVGEAWLLHYRLVSRTYPNGTTVNIMEYGPTREQSQMLGSHFYVSATWIRNNVQEPWRSKLLAMNLGRDNFIHADEQDKVSFLDSQVISGNLPYTWGYTVSGRSTMSFTAEVEMSSQVAVQCGFNILGIGASGKVTVGLTFDAGITQETSTERTTEIGYQILDHDSGDTLHVDIYYDKVFGTYLFITNQVLTSTTNPQEYTPIQHKVAIMNVGCSKTVVGQGYSTNVIVTAANPGLNAETPLLTVYAGTSTVGSQNVNIPSQSYTDSIYTWNTNGWACGSYTLNASAQPLPGQLDTLDNNHLGGQIIVSIPGDINGDYKVSLSDLSILAKAYGSKPRDAKWNPNADINNDGKVSLSDLVILAKHYGQHT